MRRQRFSTIVRTVRAALIGGPHLSRLCAGAEQRRDCTGWLGPTVADTPLIQRGDCTRDQCGQFSISISDGQVGLTVRFESEGEFRRFLEQGEAAAPEVDRVGASSLIERASL
jgi:hypothetical protein